MLRALTSLAWQKAFCFNCGGGHTWINGWSQFNAACFALIGGQLNILLKFDLTLCLQFGHVDRSQDKGIQTQVRFQTRWKVFYGIWQKKDFPSWTGTFFIGLLGLLMVKGFLGALKCLLLTWFNGCIKILTFLCGFLNIFLFHLDDYLNVIFRLEMRHLLLHKTNKLKNRLNAVFTLQSKAALLAIWPSFQNEEICNSSNIFKMCCSFFKNILMVFRCKFFQINVKPLKISKRYI